MQNVDYKKYIQSKEWKEVKVRYRQSKLPQDCYICGTREKIHLHHKSYKRLGNERLTDLIPLCEKCHSMVHQKLREDHSQKLNLWTMASRIKKVAKGKYSNRQNNINNGL